MNDVVNQNPDGQGGQGGNQGGGSLLNQGGNPNDWLPEKFRTVKEGGSDLDLEASARKLATSYAELEKSRGAPGTLPKTAEEYLIEGMPDGVNIDEVKADPLFKGILGRAHEAGIPQEHVNFFLKEYFGFAPDLLASNVAATQAEARAELGKVWPDDQAMQKNLGQAMRAVQAFAAEGDAAGSLQRLQDKYGNDPDFLHFAAAVGAELSEDTPINGSPSATQDWDAKIAALRADPAYSDKSHPQHRQKVDEVSALYQKRYGTNARQLGSSAVR
ncbi:hypothetical protein [Stenotrophomonas maltophilia]|uniref:hypothetical protein n=1 Tax=Stenotrophomonas maltophilia TaxID=40324 RepID=UPI0039C38686